MTASRLRKTGFAALAVALLIVSAILIASFAAWHDFQGLAAGADQSRDILHALAGVYSGVLDAESGQRGFLLTGRDSYLRSFYLGSSQAASQLAALEEAVHGLPSQRARVIRLESLISDKLAELQRTIDARKQGRSAAALDIVLTNQGKALMDKIKQVCTEIDSSQYTLSGDQDRELRNHELRNAGSAAAGSVLLLFLLTGAIFALNRYAFQRDRLMSEVEQSKQEITEVKDLLQTTLGSIGDAVIATDEKGFITFSNPIAQSLTGWTFETGRRIQLDEVFRIVNEETRQAVESPVGKVLRLGTIVGLANHTILIRRDGSEIHIDDSGAPIRDQAGKLIGVVLVFRDIGERRRTEIELEKAARRTRDLLESIGDGFLSFDASFSVVYANEAAARLLDCQTPARLVGHNLWTECPSLAGTPMGAAMLRAMKERQVVEIDDFVCGRWIAMRAYPAQTGLSVYVVDITENKTLTIDLQASRSRLHKSLSAAHAALWEWNVRTGETIWSEEYETLLGAKEKLEFSRANTYAGLHASDRHIFDAYLRSVDEGNQNAPQLEFRIGPDGEPTWVALTGEIVEWEQGRPVRLAGIAIDITERKRLENKLREAAKLESLGVLAGGIAHDFNNLLTAIIANASIAAEGLGPGHPLLPPVSQAIEAGERAADLTRQMLAYSGKGSFVVAPLDVSREVADIVQLLRASISHKVELKLVLNDALPAIKADSSQFQQLVMNLVINGAEAMGEDSGTVTVSTGVQQVDERYARSHLTAYPLEPGPYVVLEVQDTGHGMDAETQARIFDPFFSTKFTGRGLGLAAVQGIMRGLKGGIEVNSNPGFGTTFRIFFPAAGTAPVRKGKPTAAAAEGRGIVLVADDEKMVQQVTARALQRAGFEVLLAENGHEAVDVFARNKDAVRLIILDLTMPVMSGEEALEQLRRIRPDVPILAASGFSESDALQRFRQGVEGFLQKPYTAARLIEQVSRILNTAPVRADSPA